MEIADGLIELHIPFAFITGYDYLVEPRHEKLPILQKPFTTLELSNLLDSFIGPGSPTGEFARLA